MKMSLETLGADSAPTINIFNEPGFLQVIREQMLKFASLQLRDRDLAEDAVQEALLGALKNVDSFTGRAALKTWVFTILKNKIIDIIRKRNLSTNDSDLLAETEEGKVSDLFDHKGSWHTHERPGNWSDPEVAFKQDQFWAVFEV